MTYTEAVDWLKSTGFKIKWGDDLKRDAEQTLTAKYGPMLVTHYPGAIKFFNMKENKDDPRLVNCCDMLLPVTGEVIGCSERLESWQRLAEKLHDPRLMEQFRKVGGNCLDFKWYLDLRRKTPVHHGGFGVGIERLVQYIIGSKDIRDASLYPRDADNIYP
jgi:asparaginyl-tRNA synthetase